MDKNKCPKLKIQKNFPQKISYINATYGGTFFCDILHNLKKSSSSCSRTSLSMKLNNICISTKLIFFCISTNCTVCYML